MSTNQSGINMKQLFWKQAFFNNSISLQNGSIKGNLQKTGLRNNWTGVIDGIYYKIKSRGLLENRILVTNNSTKSVIADVNNKLFSWKSFITLSSGHKYQWHYSGRRLCRWSIVDENDEIVICKGTSRSGEILYQGSDEVLVITGFCIFFNHLRTKAFLLLLVILLSFLIFKAL